MPFFLDSSSLFSWLTSPLCVFCFFLPPLLGFSLPPRLFGFFPALPLQLLSPLRFGGDPPRLGFFPYSLVFCRKCRASSSSFFRRCSFLRRSSSFLRSFSFAAPRRVSAPLPPAAPSLFRRPLFCEDAAPPRRSLSRSFSSAPSSRLRAPFLRPVRARSQRAVPPPRDAALRGVLPRRRLPLDRFDFVLEFSKRLRDELLLRAKFAQRCQSLLMLTRLESATRVCHRLLRSPLEIPLSPPLLERRKRLRLDALRVQVSRFHRESIVGVPDGRLEVPLFKAGPRAIGRRLHSTRPLSFPLTLAPQLQHLAANRQRRLRIAIDRQRLIDQVRRFADISLGQRPPRLFEPSVDFLLIDRLPRAIHEVEHLGQLGVEKQSLVAGPQGPFEIPRLECLAAFASWDAISRALRFCRSWRPGRVGACGFAADSAAACSMASMSSRMSESHRTSLSSMAFRKASSWRSVGRSWADGIAARWIRTGITRMRSFFSALATSTRRKSSALSRRRGLSGILMFSHSRPMIARSTEHDSSSFLMNLRKSAPGGMLSVSLKIRSEPNGRATQAAGRAHGPSCLRGGS